MAPINPLIALQTQGIDTATPTRNLLGFAQQQQQNEQQQELLDMKKEALDREAESDRVESSLIGGATLNRLLEDNNIEGAKNYLRTRGKNLIDNGINPDGTFGAMKMLEEDPERLQQITKGMEQEALTRGLIEKSEGGGFTLSPGQARFDAMGNPIASLPDDEAGTQREREIDELLDRGFTLPDAQDIASDRVDVVTDDFGQTFLVNKATGERRKAGESESQEEERGTSERSQAPDTGESADLEEAAIEGTGPFASARQFANRTIGPFMEGQPFPETQKARQQLRIFNQQIKQSLTANPRNPVAELNTIQGFLPNPDTIFTDPEGERQNLRELRGFLSRRRELNEQQLDTAFIPNRERKRLAEQNAQIDQAMQLMQDFGGDEEMEAGPAKFTSEEDAQKAIDRGDLSVGDEIMINGQKFRVEE